MTEARMEDAPYLLNPFLVVEHDHSFLYNREWTVCLSASKTIAERLPVITPNTGIPIARLHISKRLLYD
jgi:hypothetical protein